MNPVGRTFRPSFVFNSAITNNGGGPSSGPCGRLRAVVVRGARCSMPRSRNVVVGFDFPAISLLSFRGTQSLVGVNCGQAVTVVSSVGTHIPQHIRLDRIGGHHTTCGRNLPPLVFRGVCIANMGRSRGGCVRSRLRHSVGRRFSVRRFGHTCFGVLACSGVGRVLPRTICGQGRGGFSLCLSIGVGRRVAIKFKNGISSCRTGRLFLKLKCRCLEQCTTSMGTGFRINGSFDNIVLGNHVCLRAEVPACLG